jgi:hypothetical protein
MAVHPLLQVLATLLFARAFSHLSTTRRRAAKSMHSMPAGIRGTRWEPRNSMDRCASFDALRDLGRSKSDHLGNALRSLHFLALRKN